jgi:hypothetical protein
MPFGKVRRDDDMKILIEKFIGRRPIRTKKVGTGNLILISYDFTELTTTSGNNSSPGIGSIGGPVRSRARHPVAFCQ